MSSDATHDHLTKHWKELPHIVRSTLRAMKHKKSKSKVDAKISEMSDKERALLSAEWRKFKRQRKKSHQRHANDDNSDDSDDCDDSSSSRNAGEESADDAAFVDATDASDESSSQSSSKAHSSSSSATRAAIDSKNKKLRSKKLRRDFTMQNFETRQKEKIKGRVAAAAAAAAAVATGANDYADNNSDSSSNQASFDKPERQMSQPVRTGRPTRFNFLRNAFRTEAPPASFVATALIARCFRYLDVTDLCAVRRTCRFFLHAVRADLLLSERLNLRDKQPRRCVSFAMHANQKVEFEKWDHGHGDKYKMYQAPLEKRGSCTIV